MKNIFDACKETSCKDLFQLRADDKTEVWRNGLQI